MSIDASTKLEIARNIANASLFANNQRPGKFRNNYAQKQIAFKKRVEKRRARKKFAKEWEG